MLWSDFNRCFDLARRRALRFPRLFRLRVTLRAVAGVSFLSVLALICLFAMSWALMPVYEGELLQQPLHSVLQMLSVVPALWLFLILVRALRTRLPEPDGLILVRDEAPRFFSLLDRMARRFRTGPIHQVRVIGDLNAAITQRSGSALLNLRNTLVVGLPLALALTPRQFVAVLAHEFGHLRRQRVALGGWGCRVRSMWHQVLENMETQQSHLQPILAALARVESTVYCAESLVLSHLDEFEADAAAAEVVGPRRLGQALAEVALKHRFLSDDYWRKVYAQADSHPSPNILPYRHMDAALRAGFDREALAEAFADLADEEEDAPEAPLGTHPSLRKRIRALGLEEPDLSAGGESAARRFFGPALGRLTGALDRLWWDSERRSWRRRHREVNSALSRIARLESEEGELGVSERLELALLVERYAGDRDPLAVYRDIIPYAQGRPEALLAMGRMLLSRGDPAGIAYLRQAIREDDTVGLQAAALLVEHGERSGQEFAVGRYRKRLAHLLRQAALVQAAVDLPLGELRCLPPGLEMYELRTLVRELRRYEILQAAYVVRRRCDLAPSWRAYVLILCVAPEALEVAATLAQEIEAGIVLNGVWRVLVAVQGGAEEGIAARVRGAKIHSRRRKPLAT